MREETDTHRGRDDYEERQEGRRERLEERADKLRRKAQAANQVANRTAAGIPMGQPILINHHSEKRHRRDLKRIQNKTFEAIDTQRKADRLEQRAESVGKAGISSDDPEAVVKLNEKIAQAEEQREAMKNLNRAYKKQKGDWDAIKEGGGFSDKLIVTAKCTMEITPWEKKPIPTYALTNLGGNIRRMKKRVEELREEGAAEARGDIEGDGYTVTENTMVNRLQIIFDGKPSEEIRRLLKGRGFRWSPYEGAWQRLLNNASRYAASEVVKTLNTNQERG